MIDNVVTVGYDSSEGSRAAAEWALDEADRSGARVRLVYVLSSPVHPAGPVLPIAGTWPPEDLRAEAERLLADVGTAASATHPEVQTSTEVGQGGPVPVLLEHSGRSRLLVLGSRGHGGFAGLLLGSVSTAVSAHAHCPVVVVRLDRPKPQPNAPVVVGVDGSPCSHLALRFAFEAAEGRRVGLHVLRAFPPAGALWSAQEATPPGNLHADEEAELAELAAGWRDKYPTVTATTEAVADSAAAALVRASFHAQLVVVGSRGLDGFRGMLVGSVSRQLLHHGHCPVAVVREVLSPDVVGV